MAGYVCFLHAVKGGKKMKKGFFAALMCALVMVLLPAAVYAADGNFGGGDDSEDDPYIIEDAEDLKEFRDIVNGQNGKTQNSAAWAELTADIVLEQNVLDSDGSLNGDDSDFAKWTPIGNRSEPYTGTFDGNGHTISGIYINTSENYQGLFGCIGDIKNSGTGTVKNLGIEDSWISGGDNVGGIAGYSSWGMENCYNKGSISGGNNVGGISGQNISGMIRNCYNTGSISGGSNVGGIVGNSSDGSGFSGGGVTGCHNDGTVIGSGSCIGGILGDGSTLSAIGKCYNTGSVSGKEGTVGGISGGIVLATSNCYNAGTISGEEAYGITAGNLTGVVNSYNIGKVYGHAILGGQEMDQAKNNYYLKGSATLEVDEEKEKAEEKTFDEFASGEVAYLLYKIGVSKDEPAWGQKIGEDFPIITEDKDLRVYKVTFMVNGREYAVAYGNSYGVFVMPDEPRISGGSFKYWVDEDGEKFTKDSSVKENMTVTAEEIPGSSYELTEGSSIRFETNGGTEIKTVYVQKGDVVDLSGYVPERSGYIFDGWYTGNDFEEKVDEIEAEGGSTVYAKWTKAEDAESGENGESGENEEMASPIQTYTDVSIFDWYNEGVMYVSQNGIMNGVGDGKFEPGTELKREMLATILWNMEGKPEPKDIAPFLDVMSGEYYSKAIAWASENGIISGYGTEYGIGESVTREDFASILYRYAVYKGYDTTQGGMAVREFADYEEISDYAKTPVSWAVNTGIISGMGDGQVSPGAASSRGQAAVMLMNFCKNVK